MCKSQWAILSRWPTLQKLLWKTKWIKLHEFIECCFQLRKYSCCAKKRCSLIYMVALPLNVTVPFLLNQSQKITSFSPSKWQVLNVGPLVQCEECNMWCLLLSSRNPSVHDKKQLARRHIHAVTVYTCTCAAILDELHLPDNLNCVVVRVHSCYDPVKKLYYSANFELLCIYCSS